MCRRPLPGFGLAVLAGALALSGIGACSQAQAVCRHGGCFDSAHPQQHATPASTTRTMSAAGSTRATGTERVFARRIVAMVNAERAKAGCEPLTVNAKLQAVAQEHSEDMAVRNYYAHETPEGIDPGTRMVTAGYQWQMMGENIYRSPWTPRDAMEGWMNSPGHRDNILDCRFRDTGVGVKLSSNGPWWTEDFGRP
jgi:uncharacterized protein YkwD